MSNTKTYYKATRPDRTDFYTRTILYEVGKTVRPAKTSSVPRICGPGFLHASDVPAETLIGGSWPCRLFEVSGKPYVGFDSEHRHKGGFEQLKVIRELDPYLALGPNGRYIAGVVERSKKLTTDEIYKLNEAEYAAEYAAMNMQLGMQLGMQVMYAARYAAMNAASYAATYAARYAAIAILAKDLITTEQFEILYGPWRSVFGEPVAMEGLPF